MSDALVNESEKGFAELEIRRVLLLAVVFEERIIQFSVAAELCPLAAYVEYG